MEYKIASHENLLELEIKVNDLIKEGWKPQGGIFQARWSQVVDPTYHQAMIKE